jgi:hypothetical protein
MFSPEKLTVMHKPLFITSYNAPVLHFHLRLAQSYGNLHSHRNQALNNLLCIDEF